MRSCWYDEGIMQNRLTALGLTFVVVGGCAANRGRDLQQVTAVDLPAAPPDDAGATGSGSSVTTPVVSTPKDAFGLAHGRKGTRVQEGAAHIQGRLPPNEIQLVVRKNFGRLRMCYENGLRSDPSLAGTVSVAFIIDANGATGSVGDKGSTMTDARVLSCVVDVYRGMSFPKPENGTVTVVYPIQFTPGDPPHP
jgi:hypothetical protein